jgi:hypothetical protein
VDVDAVARRLDMLLNLEGSNVGGGGREEVFVIVPVAVTLLLALTLVLVLVLVVSLLFDSAAGTFDSSLLIFRKELRCPLIHINLLTFFLREKQN